ncbi:M23 family metallopeptidase [Desulfolucanica intricata]|uniref:M23 family metallopeptidase n=1 Tax=Desulfolucanica intricata TaxID=1285191 RepID=UPI0008346D1C|nr:M23 family metallopeptidase [Desulfolucanica intricata]
MWPFKHKELKEDGTVKHRKWLKRWLLGGWIIYASIAALTLAVVMVPAVRAQVGEWISDRLIRQTQTVSQERRVQEVSFEEPAPAPAKAEKPKEKPAAEKTEQVKQAPPEEFIVNELARPVSGIVINGYGNTYSEVYRDYRFHGGLDFAAEPGTAVLAALGGTVAEITENSYQGKTVTVDHGSGWQTKYTNLDQVQVSKGQTVAVGAVIGTVGKFTGDVKENHVHFALIHNGEPVNPTPYFDFN